jgi:hypothetical protein
MPGGSFRVHKKVISRDTGNALLCCWTDCEKYGYDLYQAKVNYGTPGYPHVVKYVFCSETHKMYWVRSGQRTGTNNERYNDGQLASGDRRRY